MALLGKVLIIVENLPVPFDRRVWQEATTLENAGYQVSVICPKGKGYDSSYEVINGVHVYRHNLALEADHALGYFFEYTSALIWELILSWKILIKHGFDVIHACNPPDNIFLIGLFYKILFRKKFIFDHHDINPELYIAKFHRKDIFYHFLLLFERFTFACSDLSIATNESYKAIAVQRGKMSPEDVFIVRSGPDLNRLQILPPNENLKKGKQYLVGYVGVMGKQEGIDILLRAIRIIVNEYDRHDIHFGLVGGGTELELMRSYARELNISDYVTFTGRVSDIEMLEMLNTADICVNPDVVNEMNDKSTMNKIMEYMALGKPIVQFEMTEGRVSAQKASLYAKPNDENDLAEKMIELLDNEVKRQTMGDFGRNRVINKLSWQHEAPNLILAYERIFYKNN
jgi:glycosyltransferase involved in cell wall biosynthesis